MRKREILQRRKLKIFAKHLIENRDLSFSTFPRSKNQWGLFFPHSQFEGLFVHEHANGSESLEGMILIEISNNLKKDFRL